MAVSSDWSGAAGGFNGPGNSGGSGGEGEDPVRIGLGAAAERLSRHGIEMPWEEIGPSIEQALRTLEREPIPSRAVELFIELVAVGATARIIYHEAPATTEDMERFLRSCSAFINSYWHPPP